MDVFLEHIDSHVTGSGTNNGSKLDNEELQLINDVIVGVADVHLRQGHKQRHDVFAWFYRYLCNMAYLRDSLSLCAHHEFNEDGWRDVDVSSMKMRTEQRLVETQEMFVRHLRRHLVIENGSTLNEEWLESFVQYINDKFKVKKPEVPEINIESVEDATAMSADQQRADSSKKPAEKRMEFTKIQKAISRLVQNVTQDIRRRYHRKKLPEETLRSSVSCQLLAIMSPMTDDSELEAFFESLIAVDEELTSSGAAGAEGKKSRASSRRGSLSRLSSRRCSTTEAIEGKRHITQRHMHMTSPVISVIY